MPSPNQYADDICLALPPILLQQRLSLRMSGYALEKASGVSREMIRRIESGDSIPTLHVGARLACAMGMTLTELMILLDTDVG